MNAEEKRGASKKEYYHLSENPQDYVLDNRHDELNDLVQSIPNNKHLRKLYVSKVNQVARIGSTDHCARNVWAWRRAPIK